MADARSNLHALAHALFGAFQRSSAWRSSALTVAADGENAAKPKQACIGGNGVSSRAGGSSSTDCKRRQAPDRIHRGCARQQKHETVRPILSCHVAASLGLGHPRGGPRRQMLGLG